MSTKIQSNTLTTGFAMFSMFFGAGNIVFPLAMGQFAQNQNIYAILGLLITAVGVPFLGLVAMTLFDGNYKNFFEKIGKAPGFLLAFFIMLLIGPFGAMPRVIAFSYSTAKMFMGDISLPVFSALSCLLIYVMTYKQSRILDILGFFLTPILLISLAILVVKGLLTGQTPDASGQTNLNVFLSGVWEGYNTMDLLATFFFSSVVILCLKKELHPESAKDYKKVVAMTLKASCIGASLLAIVYIGISFVAAKHSQTLAQYPSDEMLGQLSIQMLGPYAGIIAVVAVSLACLTTAIALAAVFSEFIHEDISNFKISYPVALIFTLIVTFLLSTLNFSGIMSFLAPILFLIYPSLIVLALVNLLHKLYSFPYIKGPVFATFAITGFYYLYQYIAS
jgi:branched-chain amino acid:cation transporter, LIVCS family